MRHELQLDPRIQGALGELRGIIAKRYPTATFEVARGHDEPENIHLLTVVDVEDADEVLDLVIDRVVELQVDERLPVHVIPVRTPERIEASRQIELQGKRRARTISPQRQQRLSP
jgi:hypothetical protein